MFRLKQTVTLSAIIIFLGTFLSLTACKDDVFDISSEDNNAKLIETLQNYNNNLKPIPASRSIGWAGWLSVAIADGRGAYKGAKIGGRIGAILGPKGAAAGAAAGGAIAGGAASYTQYQVAKMISEYSPHYYKAPKQQTTTKRETFAAGYVATKGQVSAIDYTLGEANGLDTRSIKIAVQHNKILDKVEQIETANNQQELMANLTDLEKQIVESEAFIEGYNQIVDDPLATEVEPGLTSDQVMNLFVEAVSSSCQDQNDLNQIIAYYTATVQNSNELSDEEKEWLYAGFAVMGYSFEYWSEEWPYEGE